MVFLILSFLMEENQKILTSHKTTVPKPAECTWNFKKHAPKIICSQADGITSKHIS